MKARIFSYFTAVVILMASSNVCNAEERKFEDYLTILREKVGPTPYVGKNGDLQTIREDKKPGQRFLHVFNMTINGRATAMSKRLKGWWNSSSSVNFCHETNLQIRETIISDQNELNQGIVRSKFEVTRFSENLISANAAYEFNHISSNSILRFLKNNGTVLKFVVEIIAGGAAKITPPQYRPIITFVGTVGPRLMEMGLKCIPEDGYVNLSQDTVRSICPDYDSFCTKVSALDDAVVIATWEYGKGFTELRIQSRASEEDKELLTKLVYRSNPAISGRWYPAKFKSVKTVDAEEIGGMIFTSAVECDKIDGQIRIKNRGLVNVKSKDYNNIVGDDLTSHDQNVKFTEIGIVENGLNSINLRAKHDSIESLSASFIPHGRFFIAEKSANLPKFVRSASIAGKFDVRIDNKKGIFQELNIDGRSGRVNVTYLQVYLDRK